jgi:hypothetical protein
MQLPLSIIIATIDPTTSFAGVEKQNLLEACGLIPYWVDPYNPEPFEQQVTSAYQYPCFEFKGSTITDDGTYKSNCGDPDLKPLVKWERQVDDVVEQMYMYEYAIVAFRSGGRTYVTRMD